jgi:hypothetical protein
MEMNTSPVDTLKADDLAQEALSKSQVKRIAIQKGEPYPYDADGNRVDSGEVGNG